MIENFKKHLFVAKHFDSVQLYIIQFDVDSGLYLQLKLINLNQNYLPGWKSSSSSTLPACSISVALATPAATSLFPILVDLSD